jgi:hypothetical protein
MASQVGWGGELLAPPVNFGMGACTASLKGSDDVYGQRCPDPWVNIDAQPGALTARAIFPRDYYEFLRKYVAFALQQQPSTSASPKAKVLWLLDVQSVTTMALLCLNIPLHGQAYTRKGFLGLPDPNPTPANETASPVLAQFLAAQKMFYDNIALARYQGYDPRLSADPKIKAELDAAPIMPAALATLPVFWIGNAYRQFTSYDQVYALLFGGIVPTQAPNWYSIPSFANKDAASLQDAQARNDQPLIRGIYQWRMWCVRDGLQNIYTDPSIAPLGMGIATSTANLVDYIAAVGFEKQSPELVLRNGRLYPNFAYSFQSASRIAAQLAGIDYQLELRRHMARWVVKNSPKFDSDGNPPIDPQTGNYVMQPATYTDNDDFLRGLSKAVADRAKLAVANPAYACGTDKACQTAWAGTTVNGTKIPGAGAVYALAAHSPLGVFIQGGLALASLLINKFGAAIGGGYWPFYVVEQPLARTFTASGYRTVPDGSSVDVVPRVLMAVQALEQLTGLALLTAPPALKPPPVASAARPTEATVSPVTDPCATLLATWAKNNPELAKCIDHNDQSAMITACHAAESGRMTQKQANASIAATIDAACKRASAAKAGTVARVGLFAVLTAAVASAGTAVYLRRRRLR